MAFNSQRFPTSGPATQGSVYTVYGDEDDDGTERSTVRQHSRGNPSRRTSSNRGGTLQNFSGGSVQNALERHPRHKVQARSDARFRECSPEVDHDDLRVPTKHDTRTIDAQSTPQINLNNELQVVLSQRTVEHLEALTAALIRLGDIMLQTQS